MSGAEAERVPQGGDRLLRGIVEHECRRAGGAGRGTCPIAAASERRYTYERCRL